MIEQIQLDNVEYFKYLGCLITHGARCTHETKFNIACQKQLQKEGLPEQCT
jgi:hypothetical protein